MTYEELLADLYAARRGGVVLELSRVRRCLARLGHPERKLGAVAQIGGTNGKGSTAAFVEGMLEAAGVRSAVFSSPHLVRLAERFRVAGEPLAEEAICEAAARVAAADPGRELTFFERVTAMAVCAFADAGVEVAVLEVGLGGRLDATTAVPAQVTAVTGVALDHQDYLGPDLASIAREKAGIFRRGAHAIIGGSGEPEAVPLLVAAAERVGAASVAVVAPGARLPPGWKPGLAGAHQNDNAACAVAVADALGAAGAVDISAAARRRGVAGARLAGRLQVIAEAPRIVVDGAHNPHAARALAAALAAMSHRRLQLVVAVSSGKDVDGIAAALAPVVDAVIATRSSSARAMAAEQVAAAFERVGGDGGRPAVTTAGSVALALAWARAAAAAEDTIAVAGSLFAVGDALCDVCGEVADPVPVSDPLGAAAR